MLARSVCGHDIDPCRPLAACRDHNHARIPNDHRTLKSIPRGPFMLQRGGLWWWTLSNELHNSLCIFLKEQDVLENLHPIFLPVRFTLKEICSLKFQPAFLPPSFFLTDASSHKIFAHIIPYISICFWRTTKTISNHSSLSSRWVPSLSEDWAHGKRPVAPWRGVGVGQGEGGAGGNVCRALAASRAQLLLSLYHVPCSNSCWELLCCLCI